MVLKLQINEFDSEVVHIKQLPKLYSTIVIMVLASKVEVDSFSDLQTIL